jgi:hypothetical protein
VLLTIDYVQYLILLLMCPHTSAYVSSYYTCYTYYKGASMHRAGGRVASCYSIIYIIYII